MIQIDVRHCRECRGEFVATVETCPDCGVPLTWAPAVDERFAPTADDTPGPVLVATVFDVVEVGLLRAALEEAGIEFTTVDRFSPRAIFGSVERETDILVAPGDAEHALEVVGALDLGER